MIKVALINSKNEVAAIVSPSDDSFYLDGQKYGEHLAIHLPAETPSNFVETKYYANGEFLEKPEKPADCYFWSGNCWEFDDKLFALELRSARNIKLSASDWTQMPDAPLTEQQRTAWAIYRQSLRDVPQNNLNAESIDDIIWPTKPE